MKKIFYFWALILVSFVPIQEKKQTKTGSLTFEASVPAFEEVKAKNDAVTCVLNTATGDIATQALMKGFRFKVALMEEHFNENYVESTKFPKATFRGKIEAFDESKLTTAFKNYTIKGKLEMHGKTKEVTCEAKIKKTGETIEIKNSFTVNAADFDIDIPSAVSKKVSKKINVEGVFSLK
jgi:YceI-like domain